jgi:hypothetical protein
MFAAAAILAAATGCEVVEDLLGTGGGPDNADRLVLQSITLESDHPAVAGEVQGAAVGTSGALVRFEATGHFVNIDDGDAPVDRSVNGGVLWQSSAPLVAQPGSDGRVLLTTTGATTISVSSPAAGDVPALESNEIVLTVMTAGTGS